MPAKARVCHTASVSNMGGMSPEKRARHQEPFISEVLTLILYLLGLDRRKDVVKRMRRWKSLDVLSLCVGSELHEFWPYLLEGVLFYEIVWCAISFGGFQFNQPCFGRRRKA